MKFYFVLSLSGVDSRSSPRVFAGDPMVRFFLVRT